MKLCRDTAHLVDLPPFFGALIGESLVNQGHNLVEQLAASNDKHMNHSA
jgi:hypothetical protein